MKTFNLIQAALFENVIGQFKDNIEIVYAIDKTIHGGERQDRHQDTKITDKQITDTINAAMDQIVNALVFNKVDVGPKPDKNNRIWIYDSLTNLNVVVALMRSQDSGKIQVYVITVMITPNFNNKYNTYKITI